jgi:Histidine kinase/ATP dependent DNA ligase C terminal region/ATP dependent DNA ligase domain
MSGMRPMLATAGPLPDGPGWAYEFAWDGARTLAEVTPNQVRLIGGERGLAASYPELDVLRSVGPAVLDGAVVALDAFGRPSLPRLRRRAAVQHPSAAMLRRLPVAYYVFDLLRLGDRDTTQLPYQQRRRMLEELGLPGGPVQLAPAFDADGQAVLDTARQYGLHGIVAKRARSRYQPGRRTRSWVETALRRTQDVVIGGWVPGRDGAVASLLVGVPSERGLHYAGKVTGFTEAAREELTDRLSGLASRTSPFAGRIPAQARWTAPELLAEVSYRRWTADGRLERPAWGRLRPGRHPAAVQSPLVLPAAIPDDTEDLAEAVRKARAEVDALKAQISPHFLYNVLNMVASYVRIDPALARDLLVDFAGFARYSFRTGVELSTVADELENVERYLNLQRARFGERLRVELQVSPAVLAVTVPFLALQLAVEHAVQHSIELKPGGGTLTISAVPSGADCLVTVADDGAGGEPGPTLRTLDDRLRATYGQRRGLIIDAPPGGGGTHLRFLAPLHR